MEAGEKTTTALLRVEHGRRTQATGVERLGTVKGEAPMQISFDRAAAQEYEHGLQREWLVTNGLGGYSSGTLVGVNTRRYHGLLIAAIVPPVQRMALLVRLNDALTLGEDTVELMTAEYQEEATVYPEGFRHIESFALEDGIPTWTFNVNGCLLRRTIWMIPGHNITVIRYKLAVGQQPVELALRPLCAARDHHANQHGSLEWHFAVDTVPDGARIQATPDSPPLWLLARGATFLPAGDWYWKFLLRQERERGYDHFEDLYQPGTFRTTLEPGGSLTLIATAEDPAQGLPDPDVALAAMRAAHGRATSNGNRQSAELRLRDALQAAAEQFLVRRMIGQEATPQTSVIAGYHWFTDWGRDAMICLPGLLLGTGRVAEGASLLRTFAASIDRGMIPNRFPDSGEQADYHTADATLWFFQALSATLDALNDDAAQALLAELYPRLEDIIEWHQRGTRYGIGVDAGDGLLRAGQADPGTLPTQLTWMDARTGGQVFTPRVGKPVEINALWINALQLMACWAPRRGDDPEPYKRAADTAASSFAQRFWYEAGGYLFDVVDGPGGDDHSLRPNQVIALAIEPLLIQGDRARAALQAVTDRLLTPYGLRTLAPEDPQYVGRCAGDQLSRDRAYHQGTVWPWLLGPYAEAHRKLHRSPEAITALLEPFHAHLRDAGLGSISEIFDGDPPHTPRGCIAQGWSVGELLRIARSVE
jgi:predicted glycogen debranching enzyme